MLNHFKTLLTFCILGSLFHSCCKQAETIYIYNGVKASLYDKGASELTCNYPFDYFFVINNKSYACINLPDSLNNPKWLNYEINYKLLNSTLSCKTDNNNVKILNQIELLSAKRY